MMFIYTPTSFTLSALSVESAARVEAKNRFDLAMRPDLSQQLAEAYRNFLDTESEVMAEQEFNQALKCRARHSCPMCAADDHQFLLRAHSLDHVHCLACGLVFTTQVAETEFDKAHYRRNEAISLRLPLVQQPAWRTLERERARYLFARLAEHGAQFGGLLDIGAGAGAVLMAAAEAGIATEGVEINAAYAATHHEADLQVKYGAFPEDFSPQQLGRFSAITMLDVLEHTVDPVAFLAETARYLKEDGLLAVQTPNFNSLLLQIEGAENHNFCFGHWNHFTPDTLVRVGIAAGLRPLFVDTYITELHRIRTKPWPAIANAFHSLSGERLAEPDALTPVRLYANQLGYKAFVIFVRAS